jgi:16S rRNA G527 N7-methylase RsmG
MDSLKLDEIREEAIKSMDEITSRAIKSMEEMIELVKTDIRIELTSDNLYDETHNIELVEYIIESFIKTKAICQLFLSTEQED